MALRAIGLSDSTVETLQHIADTSTSSLNLMGLVNAIMGSGEHTITFLLEIMDRLKSDDRNAFVDLFSSEMIRAFFDDVVKPQMQTSLGKSRKVDERIAKASNEMEDADTPDN